MTAPANTRGTDSTTGPLAQLTAAALDEPPADVEPLPAAAVVLLFELPLEPHAVSATTPAITPAAMTPARESFTENPFVMRDAPARKVGGSDGAPGWVR